MYEMAALDGEFIVDSIELNRKATKRVKQLLLSILLSEYYYYKRLSR